MSERTQAEQDLEWLAGQLGWEELDYDAELFGIPPPEDVPCLRDHYYFQNYYWVPRYDESVDLMMELVEGMDDQQYRIYFTHLRSLAWDICEPMITKPVEVKHDWFIDLLSRQEQEATASLRLRAYRMTKEG